MWSDGTLRLIEAARDEDLGPTGDITAALLAEPAQVISAQIVPRQPGVICGLAIVPQICDAFAQRLGNEIRFDSAPRPADLAAAPAPVADGASGDAPLADGTRVPAGVSVGRLSGPRAAVLASERTVLNFLGRMSGVATLTRQFVDAARAASPHVLILDTRKTLPGWRELDKYAVRCGGGANHRFGLYDAVLIKDNHLATIPLARLAAGLSEMLSRLAEISARSTQHPLRRADTASGRAGTGRDAVDAAGRASADPDQIARGTFAGRPRFVEVEVDSLDQLASVLKVVGVDVVLLDNFRTEHLRLAVQMRDQQGLRGRVALEASGGVSLASVAEIAATGIDRISVGAITHSAPALDIGLDFDID